MDLSLTEEQAMLRNSLRSLCGDLFTSQSVRECEANPQAANPLMHQLSETGVSGLLLPEAHGGVALGMTDVVVAQAELGRALAPAYFAETHVLGATILSDSAIAEIAGGALREIALGAPAIACAVQEISSADELLESSVRLSRDGLLHGEKSYASFAAGVTQWLLVTAKDESGAPALCLSRAESSGLALTPLPNLSDSPLAHVSFAGAATQVLARGENARRIWTLGFDRLKLAIAAQAVGGAERILEITTDYAKTRVQFGQPIGAFQSIAHYLADAAVQVEGARYLTFRAAAAADDREDFSTWAAMAKLKACKVFRDVSALGVQVHGGIGFTLEADPQLYYRRAKHLELMYGDPFRMETQIGDAVATGQYEALKA